MSPEPPPPPQTADLITVEVKGSGWSFNLTPYCMHVCVFVCKREEDKLMLLWILMVAKVLASFTLLKGPFLPKEMLLILKENISPRAVISCPAIRPRLYHLLLFSSNSIKAKFV